MNAGSRYRQDPPAPRLTGGCPRASRLPRKSPGYLRLEQGCSDVSRSTLSVASERSTPSSQVAYAAWPLPPPRGYMAVPAARKSTRFITGLMNDGHPFN